MHTFCQIFQLLIIILAYYFAQLALSASLLIIGEEEEGDRNIFTGTINFKVESLVLVILPQIEITINDAFVERTSFSLPVFSHFLWIFISKIEQPNGFSELKQLIAFYTSITTCYIPYMEHRYWVSILEKFEFRHFDVWFASEQSITTYSHIHWLRQKQMLKYQ